MRDSGFHGTADEIYAIPVGERWILFSPRNMTSAMVNRAAVDAVSASMSCGPSAGAGAMGELLGKLTEAPGSANSPPAAEEKLVIIPTRSCNMRCVYCDFGTPGRPTALLDPRLACRMIDQAAEKLSAKSPAMLRIHFFGGEPLVARACVETAVHYTRMICARKGLVPWFELTTNGCFDATAVPFVGDYMDSVVISIDGDPALHDFNRRRADGSGTYAVIAENIKRLSRFPIELSLRACVTSRSADAMAAVAGHFLSVFDFDLLGFEMMAPNAASKAVGLEPPDPYRFAAGVLQAETMAANCGVRVVHGPSELIGPRATSCPVGRGTLMLTPEGVLTACYLDIERWTRRGLDPVIGRVDPVSGALVAQDKLDAVAALVDTKPRCAKCFCRRTCAGGCHIDQTPPGCSLEYDDRCRATRIITAGRLLRDLQGQQALVSFVGQPSSMRDVAEHPDDRLTTWAAGREREA